MTDTTQPGNEIFKLVEAWMETTRQFWEHSGLGSGKPAGAEGFSFDFDNLGQGGEEDRYKTYRTWETSISNFTALMRLMTSPENQDVLYKGARNFAEALVQATGDSMEHFTEFQSQLVKSFAKVGEHTKAYNFDDLDHSAFESFRELYRSEIQKYLNMPKIGLPREFHEQVSRLTDRSAIFYSHLSELLYLFLVPFEKTNQVMQQRTKQMLERGEFIEDYKEGYNEWIKILEGHYMELLKSTEYTEVLNSTIGALAAYKDVKNNVIGYFLKELQIPTNKEMDEVYRDLYQMKKQVRLLSRQVESLHNELKAINS